MSSNTVVPIPVSASSGVLNAFTASLAIYAAEIRTFFFRSTVGTDKVAIYGSNDGTTISTGVLVSMGAGSAPVSIGDRCRFYVAIFTGSGTRSCSVSVGPLSSGGGGNHLNTVALGNFAGGGVIGTAPNTVDQFEACTIAQTTAGQTLSLPTPTDPSATTTFLVENIGSNYFTLYGVIVAANGNMMYAYNGASWQASGVGTSDSGTNVIGSAAAALAVFAGSGGEQHIIAAGGGFDVEGMAGGAGITLGTDATDKPFLAGSTTGTSTMTLRGGVGGLGMSTTGFLSAACVGAGVTSTGGGIDLATVGAFSISFTPGAGAAVRLPPRAAGAGNTTPLRWLELAANGVNFVSYQAPDALAGDNAYIFPSAFPTVSGQRKICTTAGVESWQLLGNVQANNVNGQSIADGAAAAIVTTWVEVTDGANAYNNTTGVYTAPATGFYLVTAELEYTAAVAIVAAEFTVQVFKNGALYASGVEIVQVAAANCKRNPKVSLALQLTAADTIDIRASQNSGSGAVTLTAVASRNLFSVSQIQ